MSPQHHRATLALNPGASAVLLAVAGVVAGVVVVAMAAPAALAAPDAAAVEARRQRRLFAKIEKLARTAPERAAVRLSRAKLPAPQRARLRGLIALLQKRPRRALAAFEQALRAAPADARLNLYVAHAAVRSRLYARALTAVGHASSLRAKSAALARVEARALIGLRRWAAAYRALAAATLRFPRDATLRTELVALATRRGVFAEARRHARATLPLLDGSAASEPLALALTHALHGDRQSAALLERIAARYRDRHHVLAHLAYAYAGWDRPHAAARLFERATAILGGDYAFEAADQYRLAGNTRRALALNGRVTPPRRRLSQRLSILFAAKAMARVAALAPALRAAKLWTPRVRYQLAYAHYALAELVAATRLLRSLRGTSYQDAARSLLRAMGR